MTRYMLERLKGHGDDVVLVTEIDEAEPPYTTVEGSDVVVVVPPQLIDAFAGAPLLLVEGELLDEGKQFLIRTAWPAENRAREN